MKPLRSLGTAFCLTLLIISMCTSAYNVNAIAEPGANSQNDHLQSTTFDEPDVRTSNDGPLNDFTKVNEGQIETFKITSPQLGGKEKSIFVYLPSDYDNSKSSYPVIYLQDPGTGLIFYQEATGTWLINASRLEFYTKDFEKEAIVVIIKADSYYNWEEYGPWVNENMYLWMDPYEANRVEGGAGKAYLDFLIHTLKPEIDIRYRTLPDRDNTAIGGYDMGGLLSIYAGITRRDIYSRVMALSPAIWFGEEGGNWLSNNQLLKLIENTNLPKNLSLFIDVAESEKTTDIEIRPAVNDSQGKKISFPRAYLEGAQVLVETLLSNGFPEENLKNGSIELNAWDDPLSIRTEEERDLDKTYYFPLIFSPPTPSRFESFEMDITISETDVRTRTIWVYLPPNYRSSGEAYDVIYLTGIQRIFGTEIGVYDDQDWKFDETLDRLYSETGIGVIAVGIEYDRKHPWDEYTPFDNHNMDNFVRSPEMVSGKGDAFLDFIVTNLKPEIDWRYYTNPTAENTAIGGGSRHAFFALYASLTKPGIFSGVMAMSPAIWMAEDGGKQLPLYQPAWFTDNKLDQWLEDNNAPKSVQYFLHIGTKESANMPGGDYPYVKTTDGIKLSWECVYLNGADRIKNKLDEDSVILKYHRIIGDDHLPVTWGTYVDEALNWLGFYP